MEVTRKWMAERGGYGGGEAEVDEMVGGLKHALNFFLFFKLIFYWSIVA